MRILSEPMQVRHKETGFTGMVKSTRNGVMGRVEYWVCWDYDQSFGWYRYDYFEIVYSL